jgi:hypothetical protein
VRSARVVKLTHSSLRSPIVFFCTDTYLDRKSLRIQNRSDLTPNASYM